MCELQKQTVRRLTDDEIQQAWQQGERHQQPADGLIENTLSSLRSVCDAQIKAITPAEKAEIHAGRVAAFQLYGFEGGNLGEIIRKIHRQYVENDTQLRGALRELSQAALKLAQMWNKMHTEEGVNGVEFSEARQAVDEARKKANALLKGSDR